MNLFFEDFELDRTFSTAGRTVTETDVVMFAGLTGDFVELHTNEEAARRSPFGRRIAHGALVFSISLGLATRTNILEGSLVALSGIEHLRFVQPVGIGDTIHVIKRVHERRDVNDATGIVIFETRVHNQHDQIVLVYFDKLLLRRRPPA